jgi:hydroxyacylglutathione hydrolase
VAAIETHLHADFIGGARELAHAVGAQVYAAAAARYEGPHTAVAPDDVLGFGDVSVEILPTPGHTPHHIALMLRSGDRRSLFSGGSLLVGSVARTDLVSPDRTEELARAQFQSLRRIAALPDDTELYPTHGSGSFCSAGAARSRTSTLGAERTAGSLFAIEDEDTFVKTLLAGYGSYPRYFAALSEVNRVGAPPVDRLPPVSELSADAARAAVDSGAWLIDGRPVEMWARGHASGAISNEVRPAFASWLGWVVPFGERVVLMLEPDQVDEAVLLCRRIGVDRIEGWTRFATWREAGLPVSAVDLVTPADARTRKATLLDVRQHAEVAARRIPGALHLELGDLIAGHLPPVGPVIAFCGHGERSATAVSLLERAGFDAAGLDGGIASWERSGLPVER